MLGLLIVDRFHLSLTSRTHIYQTIITIFENFSIEPISCQFFLVDKSRAAEAKKLVLKQKKRYEQGSAKYVARKY